MLKSSRQSVTTKLFFVCSLLLVSQVSQAADLLKVGSMAPEIVGKDANGRPVKLSQQRGKLSVVYFYPKDDTSGCTKEAQGFRDAFDQYSKSNLVIFGVSRDSDASHTEFRKKHKLPFFLVADESGAVQRAYGVGSFFGMASRVTFLVGKDGRVVHVWPNVTPATHARDVMMVVKKLK